MQPLADVPTCPGSASHDYVGNDGLVFAEVAGFIGVDEVLRYLEECGCAGEGSEGTFVSVGHEGVAKYVAFAKTTVHELDFPDTLGAVVECIVETILVLDSHVILA